MKFKFSTIACGVTVFFFIFLSYACNTPKKINTDYIYFQRGLDSLGIVQSKETNIKINDILSIRVGSRSLNQEQASLFNMGNGDSTSSTYAVNPLGNIEMPVIGNIKAVGLTIVQLQAVITGKLVDYIKEPLVLIKYAHFTVNVLGEVKMPGTKIFPADYVTIIDAISASGDLTDMAKRDDILVIREENGQRKYYKVDLRSGSLFQSPAYQLLPNDLIYVKATDNKLKTLNKDPEKGRQLATILQFTSLIITLVTLTRTFTR